MMKNKKNLALALTFALGAVAAPLAVRAAGSVVETNKIWEVIQDSATGDYGASETITFKMRLVSPTYNAPGDAEHPRFQWTLVRNPLIWPGMSDETLMAVYPLSFGVVASGRTYGAPLVDFKSENDGRFTDFTFRYVVKCGDFALPLRTAADGVGNPIGGGKWSETGAETGTTYFFRNGPGDIGNEAWSIRAQDGTALVPELWSNDVSAHQKYTSLYTYGDHTWQPAKTAACDYLSDFNYTLKTIVFDEPKTRPVVDGTPYWRTVRENDTTSKPGDPAVETADGVSPSVADVRLYAWVAPLDLDDKNAYTNADKYAVTLPGGVARDFLDPDGKTRTHYVQEIAVASNKLSYTFIERGLTNGAAARIVLSGTPHYNYNTAGALVKDFLSETVRCIEPPVQTLSAVLGAAEKGEETYQCTADYAQYVGTVKVTLTQKYSDTAAMRVKLGFEWRDATNGVHTTFPSNYLAISKRSTGGYLPENLLPDMTAEIPAGELESDNYYIYALGSCAGIAVEPGIKVKPVALDVAAGVIKETNDCYVTVKGMDPVVTKPVGTREAPSTEITIRGGGAKAVEVTLSDSYRNLHIPAADASNEHYTVVWDTGTGLAPQSVTNDVNGLPLVPDANGRFTFSVTYPRVESPTNGYASSFYVVNPEGRRSHWVDEDGRSHDETYVTVKVTKPATVWATAKLDGKPGDTFNEGAIVDFDFEYDQMDLVERELYAYLQPCNAAASNRCEAAFLTEWTSADGSVTNRGSGILLFNQRGTTVDHALGGMKLLDGPGNPQPQFKVVLCTSETYDPAKVVTDYQSTPFQVKVLNVAPAATQLKMEDSSRYIRTSGATTDVVRLNVSRKFSVKGWNDDVPADLDATDDRQLVQRWRVYEIGDDGDENVEPFLVTNVVGKLTEFVMPGFEILGMKKLVLEVQDKDMRPYGELKPVVSEDGSVTNGWTYVMDKSDPEHDWWEDDDNGWGPAFVVYVPVSDKPTVKIEAVGEDELMGGLAVFSESRLPPFAQVADPNMGFEVTLSEPYDKGALNVKLELQYLTREGEQTSEDTTNGFVTVGVTNLVFQKNSIYSGSKVKNVSLTDFDGTWREDLKRLGYATWRLKASVMTPAEATSDKTEGYMDGACDFYVRNEAPLLSVDSKFIDCTDPSNAWEVAKNGTVQIGYTVDDIPVDLTNRLEVTCSVKGGEVVGADTLVSTGGVNVSTGEFTVRMTAAGINSVIIRATDKDFGASEIKLYFFVEQTRELTLIPAKPGKVSTDSDDIADYFSAAGIGYGRVRADSQLAGISDWIHTWTSPGGESKVTVKAIGYKAGEQEKKGDSEWPFVTTTGTDSESAAAGTLGYTSPLADKDSFFYRWFSKVSSDSSSSGSWTSDKPIPDVEHKATPKTLAFPQKTSADTTVYNDISAMAIFSREYLWSDNMGDINADGVPDAYVLKYKLTGGDFTGGKDLKDVNFGEDGKTPYCLDYLPLTEAIRYSKLVPELTDIANIENAKAFTPAMKLRGYDDHLNDAVAARLAPDATHPNGIDNKAHVDGAVPEKVYETEDGGYDATTCTVSYVEHLAWKEFKAAHAAERPTFASWSPERPTDPTKADTDNDGFTDGYEYYYWYLAHVGYLDAKGRHHRLTGRRYNPRNPGEGVLITPEEIEAIMDPLTPSGEGFATRDTDNDGLPDLLEFEIGTNPFDFDTDGDGLPDGWEIMIAGLDPLTASSALDAKHDAERNYDGDAMAFTTVKREAEVLPLPRFIQRYNTFATVNPNGDTDGIQWYAETPEDEGVSGFAYELETDAACKGTVFTADGVTYVTTAPFAQTDDGRLATMLLENTFTVTNLAEAAESLGLDASALPEAQWLRLRPVKLVAGTPVRSVTPDTAFAVARIAGAGSPYKCNAAWVYGRGGVLEDKFGFLALARYAMPKVGDAESGAKGDAIAELPSTKRDVALLHYLVYQEFGFDPRTAWNENTPLAARWGETANGEAYAGQISKKGYAGQATRTRAFTAYDEFLLYSFFLNNGCDMSGWTEVSPEAPHLAQVWGAFTTNPQGPGEPGLVFEGEHYFGRQSENGADTDGDGVPDGWELYVMGGKKLDVKDLSGAVVARLFNFAPPYAPFTASGEEVIEMPESYFSPFVAFAQKGETDNVKYIGKDMKDSLTEYQEFAGTDSCAYYSEVQTGKSAAFSTTIVRPAGHEKWLNKFFPTDPWVPDTDDDGVSDGEEGSAFTYAAATLTDDGTSTCFPGGGLNPCSVDTDMDGLPDGWENQFAGATVSTNATEGLIDGMDGTVADAMTGPTGPNRDYDHDGLENWQEYMTGTMRCWRYDDPFTQWGAIPFEAYYYIDLYGAVTFEPNFDALGIAGATEEERWNNFWYETLANVGGPLYNPHLLTDQSPSSQYFSRTTVGWDPNYWDSVLAKEPDLEKGRSGTYYWFAHRIGREKYKVAWSSYYGDKYDSKLYVSCSPKDEDTDHDGMDDFYELFHGLNPLLGGGELPLALNPCDVVCAIKEIDKSGPVNYLDNKWIGDRPANPKCNNSRFDFVAHPWKNGLQTADPDGDNMPNYVEAILPKFVTGWGQHTDPSPMWMTDASYENSLTRLHYRIPERIEFAPFDGEAVKPRVKDQNGDSVPGFTGPDGTKYYLRDFDAYDMDSKGEATESFRCNRWRVHSNVDDPRTLARAVSEERGGVGGWMFSFEENEGYDTDHDGMGDEEEVAGRFRTASDPLDFDSPKRRQAMYFPGKDAALQTPAELGESYPIVGGVYKQEPSFSQYTVECWVRAEEARDATIVERTVWNSLGANAGDAELVRKNFLLGTRKGADGECHWFTKFDSNGTGSSEKDEVAVLSGVPVRTNEWTHVAVTYDGKRIVLYVNGQPSGAPGAPWGSGLLPECAVADMVISRSAEYDETGRMDTLRRYPNYAIVVGASVKTYADYPNIPFMSQQCGFALNLYNALGWTYYKDFFKGYVDEIRIWDGARSSEDIKQSMKVRFDAETAKKNRTRTYDDWKTGLSRYQKNEDGTDTQLEPELRYHFNFDAVPAAQNAKALAAVPKGFATGEKAPLSRPEGYEVAWWKRIVDAYGSAYAGATNYVTWIPNTVAHLPRFDGTSLDSAFWSDDFEGVKAKTCGFAHTAEPYSLWTQVLFGNVVGSQRSTLTRWHLANVTAAETDFARMFDFTGRNFLCEGADLLPLGGAFARYVDAMWDDQGASSVREQTGRDDDCDGLPDWWEEYAEQNYREGVDPTKPLSWSEPLINYNGIMTMPGVAYMRDLARGAYLGEDGKVHIGPTDYLQTADADHTGMPDWWSEMYGIRGESGLDDHDHDGLPNYVEYLLSEVFAFQGLRFDPTIPKSVDPETPDYFIPVGNLYVGEIFTDHDGMYDDWEDLYGSEFLSRLVYDAQGDEDHDGWSNVSEMLAATDPTWTRSQGLEGQIIAEYPVPMIRTRVKIPDNLPDSIPIVVQAFSKSIDGKPDATWTTGAAGGLFAKEKIVGTNPGGVKRYYLSPGSISQGKVEVFFNDESALTEYYTVIDGKMTLTKSVFTGSGWYPVLTDRPRKDDSKFGDLVKYNGEIGGWINYVTGELELDFTCDALQEAAYVGETGTAGTGDNAQATETRTVMDLTRAIVSISWSAKLVKQGSLSELYLSDADEGYVREGLNAFVAWADKNGNGVWDIGEPYGVSRDVNVSWNSTSTDIELTEVSPVMPRIQLSSGEKDKENGGKSGGSGGESAESAEKSDRGQSVSEVLQGVRDYIDVTYGNGNPQIYSNMLKQVAWIEGNLIEPATLAAGSVKEQRIRIVRWLVNGVPTYRGSFDSEVVLDRRIQTSVKANLTEADVLVGESDVFDLDWANLQTDVVNDRMVIAACGNVTNVSYLVVVGDGPIGWTTSPQTNYAVKALNTVVTRRFGQRHAVPTLVSPDVADSELVMSANPTFKWRMDCPEEEGYTAFRIQVTDGSGLVFESKIQDVPPRIDGTYVWTAPLFVGDKTLQGKVFSNKTAYAWKVSMYNAKFREDAYSSNGKFYLDVQTNGFYHGTANVAVRYFGPKSTWEGGAKNGASVIRVRAYTSPDFTGTPVAAGYVADPANVDNGVAVTGKTVTANCRVLGIPRGSYYFQAFVDSNNNGVCDPWETSGYLCSRDGYTADYLAPRAMTFADGLGAGDLAVIYLEDADTDGDGLPDAWEYAEYGSLEEKGVELLSETGVGEFMVNTNLCGALEVQENANTPAAGVAGQIRHALMKLGTPAGVAAATGVDPADVVLADGGFEVRSEIDPETLTIVGLKVDAANKQVLLKVGAETTANVDATVASFLNVTVKKGATVTIKVERADSPAGPWTVVKNADGTDVGGTVTVDRAGTDVKVNLTGELPAQGFFRAKIEE